MSPTPQLRGQRAIHSILTPFPQQVSGSDEGRASSMPEVGVCWGWGQPSGLCCPFLAWLLTSSPAGKPDHLRKRQGLIRIINRYKYTNNTLEKTQPDGEEKGIREVPQTFPNKEGTCSHG